MSRRDAGLASLALLFGCHWIGGIEDRVLDEDTAGSGVDGVTSSSGGGAPSGPAGPGTSTSPAASTSTLTGGGGDGGRSGDGGAGGDSGVGGDGGGHGGGGGSAPCVPDGNDDPSVVWVDVSAPEGGTGTSCAPVRTITRGLELLAASRAGGRTLRVAVGVYEAPAEQFPLHLDGPLTILGAGDGGTLVRGSGLAAPPGMSVLPVTALVATHPGAVEIRDVAFRPEEEGTSALGLFCENGNVPASGEPPDDDVVASFRLRGVSAAGFGVALAAHGAVEGGCYLDVRGSELFGNEDAVWAWGTSGHSALRVGGADAGEGNWFHDNDSDDWDDSAVNVWGPTSLVHVEGNTFEANDVGVYLPLPFAFERQPPYRFSIVGNTFRDHTHSGIYTYPRAIVADLSDNVFTGNEKAIALVGGSGPDAPRVLRARRNVVTGNFMGLLLQTVGGPPIGTDARSDFGTPSDPGLNVFSCNALDVVIDTGAVDALQLAGNAWDHVPVTHGLGSTIPPVPWGTDLAEVPGSTATYDVSLATVPTAACP